MLKLHINAICPATKFTVGITEYIFKRSSNSSLGVIGLDLAVLCDYNKADESVGRVGLALLKHG